MKVKTEIEKIELLREQFNKYFFEVGDPLAQGVAPAAQAPAPAPAPQQQQPAPDQTMDPLAQQPGAAPASAEYTIQQFVDSLNKIRGGRSFDDQDVFQQVNTLFTGLDPVSKETLRNVISQLESIVTPVDAQGVAPEAQVGDGNLGAVQDTQAYNANVNAAPGAPPAAPASFGSQEAPPA